MIKRDTIILLSHGEYSDYEILTIGKATIDLDAEMLKTEYLQLYPERNKFKPYSFIKWLMVDKKVIQELDYTEWHLGYYDGEFTVND